MQGAQLDVRALVEGEYAHAWCAAQSVSVEPAGLVRDWDFLSQRVAECFLRAIREGVVVIDRGWPLLPDGRRTYLFTKGGGVLRLYREGFLEVAAAGLLALDYGWSPSLLSFQSPARGEAKAWAFDLLAYSESGTGDVRVAGEVKWRQKDALDLARALSICGARGTHDEAECEFLVSHHRKYRGLVEFRPSLLWIIGPEAFESKPDLVFSVAVRPGGHVQLQPVAPDGLRYQV